MTFDRRAYHKKWIADRRRRGIELLGGKCALCDSTENLEIDHTNRDKDPRLRSSGGRLWSFSWDYILEELKKCRVLCEDCHKEKTRTEAAHGEQKVKMAKLTDEAVRDIRSSSLSSRELAERYGVGYHAIWRVRTRKRWKHL